LSSVVFNCEGSASWADAAVARRSNTAKEREVLISALLGFEGRKHAPVVEARSVSEGFTEKNSLAYASGYESPEYNKVV
jgi:hypothetical protein